MGKLSNNFYFALLISFGIMAVVSLLLVIGAGACYLVMEAFNIFPYHTVFAVIIFWIFLAKKMLREINDDDNDF